MGVLASSALMRALAGPFPGKGERPAEWMPADGSPAEGRPAVVRASRKHEDTDTADSGVRSERADWISDAADMASRGKLAVTGVVRARLGLPDDTGLGAGPADTVVEVDDDMVKLWCKTSIPSPDRRRPKRVGLLVSQRASNDDGFWGVQFKPS